MSLNPEIIPMETDVLIIGGGIAGCMAAIKASEQDVNVTVVEKSNTLASGQASSGIDHLWAYLPPIHGKMGWSIDDLVEDHVQGVAHGFANRALIHFIARESYARALDLERYGVKIRYEDSTLPGHFRVVYQFHSVPSALNIEGRLIKVKLTEEVRRRGVRIVNRVMMTDLLSTHGEISAALGVGTRDGNIYLFKTKAIVLSSGGKTGRLSRQPSGVEFNLHVPPNLCGDGKAMALRAGLDVMNMEFLSPTRLGLANFDASGGPPRNTWQPAGTVVNGRGKKVVPRASVYDWGDLERGYQIDADESRREWLEGGGQRPKSMPSATQWQTQEPFYLDCTGGTEEEIKYIEWSLSHEGRCRQLLRHLQEERVDLRRDRLELGPQGREIGNLASAGLVVDPNLETEMKGLFAAGDEIGGVPFLSATGALTTGWHAGDRAARRARNQNRSLPADEGTVESLKRWCSERMSAEDGYTWREADYTLQNIMDHYCGDVRSEAMLTRGIERLKDIKNAPLLAATPHELARCLEVKSLMENAEMVMTASLARQESRKAPYFKRSDFPEQDDKNWFAFSAIRLDHGRLRVSKIPIG